MSDKKICTSSTSANTLSPLEIYQDGRLPYTSVFLKLMTSNFILVQIRYVQRKNSGRNDIEKLKEWQNHRITSKESEWIPLLPAAISSQIYNVHPVYPLQKSSTLPVSTLQNKNHTSTQFLLFYRYVLVDVKIIINGQLC